MANITAIVTFALTIFMLVSLIGTYANENYGARYDDLSVTDHNQTVTNVSGSSAIILNMVTLVFAMGIVILAIRKWLNG